MSHVDTFIQIKDTQSGQYLHVNRFQVTEYTWEESESGLLLVTLYMGDSRVKHFTCATHELIDVLNKLNGL